jgi:hypothetical protein
VDTLFGTESFRVMIIACIDLLEYFQVGKVLGVSESLISTCQKGQWAVGQRRNQK